MTQYLQLVKAQYGGKSNLTEFLKLIDTKKRHSICINLQIREENIKEKREKLERELAKLESEG